MEKLILAFDFGGTKLTAVSLPLSQLNAPAPQWAAQGRTFSPEDGDAQFDIETLIQMGQKLASGCEIVAVGVSFGGPVDFDAGVVRLSHHVPGWENMPLQTMIATAFNAPVRVDNDANAAALGEHRFGAGRGVDHLLYITVSTGVGGGWVLNKRPFRGHDGMAGEIGHTVVDPNGPICLCGKRGCVERLASGPYMAQDFVAAQDLSRKLGMVDGSIGGEDVANMAAQGNKIAQQILLRGARALGVGIGNAANLLNPQRVILGGGVTKSGDIWWSAVRQSAHATALPEVKFEIIQADFMDDAPLWGAVALVESLIV